MGTTLKGCLAAAAIIAATAARAGVDSDSSHRRGATFSDADASPGHAMGEMGGPGHLSVPSPAVKDGQADAAIPCDQRASVGSGSGEPTRGAEQQDQDWNRREFLRNVWQTP